MFRVILLLLLATTLSTAQTHTVILGRPTDRSVTASVRFDRDVNVTIDHGISPSAYTRSTSPVSAVAGVPVEIDITDLEPNTRHFYRLRYRRSGGMQDEYSDEYSFHTQRAQGALFRFAIEADEHLYDKKGIRSLYQITLDNIAAEKPDFMLSLGDTFGDDHTPDETTSEDMDLLHRDYLQYLGKVCHSAPFFFCLGNHEGENGYYLKQNPPNNIAVYGTLWRKYYYPNPQPNQFYSGNTVEEGHNMGLPENYYAWTWGDALFVVLDVYRHCDVNEKPQGWDWTLGEKQYTWFKQTLESSTAKYKFVFAHHTRGQGRGAVATAKGFEWGGYEPNKDRYEFDAKRPGWELPIHQLMVKHGVNIFFQGHDHLYAKEELDGIVYQEVPMPSDTTYTIGMLANADAYTDITRDGSGHLLVTVAPDGVDVEFVRAYLPKDTLSGEHKNREIGHSYSVGRTTSVSEVTSGRSTRLYPNPTSESITVFSDDDQLEEVKIIDLIGKVQLITTASTFDVSTLPSGVYTAVVTVASGRHSIPLYIQR